MMSSQPSSLNNASLNSYGFDYKLLPFTILGAIHHLWGPVRSLPIWSLSCLVTVKQHSTSPCTHQPSVQGEEKNSGFLIFYHYF